MAVIACYLFLSFSPILVSLFGPSYSLISPLLFLVVFPLNWELEFFIFLMFHLFYCWPVYLSLLCISFLSVISLYVSVCLSVCLSVYFFIFFPLHHSICLLPFFYISYILYLSLFYVRLSLCLSSSLYFLFRVSFDLCFLSFSIRSFFRLDYYKFTSS